ncbi:hypothetical protein ACDN41_12680 [Priestia aryabhattai]|uniref:hypothetical protein n=1 Tax=Priestia aryabhattai TaxID=412384 RepID=UPI003531D522
MTKYKVYNDNPFSVGIRFENEVNREVTIRKGTNLPLSQDDILYAESAGRLFSKGVLTVKEQDVLEMMGLSTEIPDAITGEDIKNLFKLSATKLKTELEKITEKHAQDKIIQAAKDADLQTSKLKVIKETFGVEMLEEVDEEII